MIDDILPIYCTGCNVLLVSSLSELQNEFRSIRMDTNKNEDNFIAFCNQCYDKLKEKIK